MRHHKIEKDVSTFVDVSNPKTIRLYTKELRDILDNMSRLSKIIDKGEEIDIALGKIMDGIEQLEDQWDVTLSNDLKMKETIEVVNNHIKEVDSRFQSQLGSILDKELETIDLKIAKQFEGSQALCELTGAKSYDRFVGYCSINGKDYGEILISQSACRVWKKYDIWERYVEL